MPFDNSKSLDTLLKKNALNCVCTCVLQILNVVYISVLAENNINEIKSLLSVLKEGTL